MASKKKKKATKTVPVILTRKEKRKQERQLKKKLKSQRYLNKSKTPLERLELKKKEEKEGEREQNRQKEEKERKRKENKIRNEQIRKRKKQLLSANKEEEKNIKRLEKQLGLKKRKKLPKSFSEDGLDFLLDVCDDEKLALLKEEEEGGDYLEGDEGKHFEGEELLSDDNEEEEEEEEEEEGHSEGEEESSIEEEELSEGEENQSEEELPEKDQSEREIEMELENSKEEIKESSKIDEKEDIYGRKRDKHGNILPHYVPPALRLHNSSSNDIQLRLRKKLKGLLNRLAESNFRGICSEIENLYMSHSRNDMNQVLSKLLVDSLVTPVLTPERLIMEHDLLIAVLHVNVGTEVGATILQNVVRGLHDVYGRRNETNESGKEVENYLHILCHLYSFHVTDSKLIFDVVRTFVDGFSAKDVEFILLTLKAVGFALRKDDPSTLKSVILKIKSKAVETEVELSKDSRTKFMLEILTAIKNNNVKKIPNYDPEHLTHLKTLMKTFLRPGTMLNPLQIGYEDLLAAETQGRWWIVGSAWTGREPVQTSKSITKLESFQSDLLDLAREMRMNTDARKTIFCTLMSSEDYIDAFERLSKLIFPRKEREIAFVLLDCCLQERIFNPYYAQVGMKLSSFDRKYRMSIQFSIWDKIRDIRNLSSDLQRRNLSKFVSYSILHSTFSLSILKVATSSFADLDKTLVEFLKAVLTDILLVEDVSKCRTCFSSVVGYPKLKEFRDEMALFIRHFLIKSKNGELFRERAHLAENLLRSSEKPVFF